MAQTVTTVAYQSGITDALLFHPDGDLIGSDYYNGKLFKTNISSGASELFSSGFTTCNGLVYDTNGILYMADNLGNKIYKIHPDGTSELFVNFVNPSSLIFDIDSDTLIAASYLQKKIVKIAPDGSIKNWSTGGQLIGGPNGFVYDENNNLYVCNFDDRKITKINSDGSQTPLAQAPGGGAMGGIAYANGYIYGSLIQGHKIFRTDLDGNGAFYMGAGQGTVDGNAADARFNGPNGILASSTGDTLYISDLNTSNIRMITDVQSALFEVAHPSLAITASPNPTFDTLHLTLELNEATMATLTLNHVDGKLIQTILSGEQLAVGKHAFVADIKALPSGLYLLHLTDNQGRETAQKVLIQ